MGNSARPKLRKIAGAKRLDGHNLDMIALYAPHGECFDLSGGFDDAMAACKEMQGIADALGLLEAMSDDCKKRTSGFAKAVYIISVDGDPITKIGISANPIKRHADLQATHYRELVLNAVVFCPKHNALAIEQEVLRQARANGDGLMGEWVAMDPDDVLNMVMEASCSLDVPICDGRQWFKNQLAKARALARQKHAPNRDARFNVVQQVRREAFS